MAITLNTTLRNARATAIVTEAGTSAKLAVYTSAYGTKLYESTCNASQFGTVSGGVLTMSAVGNATAIASGTAAIARLFKSDGTTMVIEGLTVGNSGTNIVITNTTIASGDTVTTSSGTITEGNA